MLLKDMVSDGYYPSLVVDPAWYEGKHPQESLPEIEDPVALWRPAPERDLVGSTVNLSGQNQQVTFGYEVGLPATEIESGLEFVESGPVFSSAVSPASPISVDIPGTLTQAGDVAVLFLVTEHNNSNYVLEAGSDGFARVVDFENSTNTSEFHVGGGILWKLLTAADVGGTATLRFDAGAASEVRAWVWTFRNADFRDFIENVFIRYVYNTLESGAVVGQDPLFLMPAPIRVDGVPSGGVIQGWIGRQAFPFLEARETVVAEQELTYGAGACAVQYQQAIADAALNNLMAFRTLTETGAGAFFTAVAASFVQIEFDTDGSITDSIQESGGVEEHGFDFSVTLTAGLTYVYTLTCKRTLDDLGTNPDDVRIVVDDGTNPVFGNWFALLGSTGAPSIGSVVGVGFNHASANWLNQASILVCRIIPTVTGSHTFEIRTGEPNETLSHAAIPIVSPDKSLQVIDQNLVETDKVRTLNPAPGAGESTLNNTYGEFLSSSIPEQRYLAFAMTLKASTGDARRATRVNPYWSRAIDTNRPEFANGTPNNPTLALALTDQQAYSPGGYGNQTAATDDNNFMQLDQAKRSFGKWFAEIVIEAGGVAGDPNPSGRESDDYSIGVMAVDFRSVESVGALVTQYGHIATGGIRTQSVIEVADGDYFPASNPGVGDTRVYSFAIDFDHGTCWLYIDGVFAGDLFYGRSGASGGSNALRPTLERFYVLAVGSLDANTGRAIRATFRTQQADFSSVFTNTEIVKGKFLPWDIESGSYTPGVYDENVNGWRIHFDSNNRDNAFDFVEWPSLVDFRQGASSNGSFTNAVVAGIGRYSGQVFWEVTVNTVGVNAVIGFVDSYHSQERSVGNDSSGDVIRALTFGMRDDGTNVGGLSGIVSAGFGNGDVVGMALDIDARTLQIFVNGVSQGTSGALANMAWPDRAWWPTVTAETSGTTGDMTINLGETAFAFTVPGGFTSYRDAYALPPATLMHEPTVAGTGFAGKTSTGKLLNGDYAISSNGFLTVTDSTLGIVGRFINTMARGSGRWTGRWYWEVTIDTLGTADPADVVVGLGLHAGASFDTSIVGLVSQTASLAGDGLVRITGVPEAAVQPTFTTGDVVSVLWDKTSGYVTFWVNGVFGDQLGMRNNGNDDADGNAINDPYHANNAGDWPRPLATLGTPGEGVTMTFNFGGTAFVHSSLLPEGYFAYDDLTQVNPL